MQDGLTPPKGDFCAYIESLQADTLAKMQSTIRADNEALKEELNQGRAKKRRLFGKIADKNIGLDLSAGAQSSADLASVQGSFKPQAVSAVRVAQAKRQSQNIKADAAAFKAPPAAKASSGAGLTKFAGNILQGLLAVCTVIAVVIISILTESGDLHSTFGAIAAFIVFALTAVGSAVLKKHTRR